MKRLVVVALVAVGCNNNVIQTPVRVFDRPSDVALTCVRGEGPGGTPASNPNQALFVTHPLSFCAPEVAAQNTLTFVDPLSGATQAYLPYLRAVVANSARGELALVDVAAAQIVDLNKLTPGFGFLPVGRLPEHVRVSGNGCQAVTTNTDSCDLGVVDLARLHNAPRLVGLADAGVPINDPAFADLVRRAQPAVKDSKGNFHALGARPTWLEYATDSTDGVSSADQIGACSTTGKRKGWVALPGCQLVAEVSLDPQRQPGSTSSEWFAEVSQAIRVTRTSATVLSPAELQTLSCPQECSGEPAVADLGNLGPADLAGPVPSGVDGGASLPTTQGFPSTVAIDTEDGVGRLFIGDSSGEKIWIVPIATGAATLGVPRAVTLEHGANGVEVVRVSPRSQAGKFLYAVARDATVRVIDLDRELECETNPDPRSQLLLSEPIDSTMAPIDPLVEARRLGCFPLGDPSTPPRNPTVVSPGITLQGGALPKDVSFVHLDVPPPPTDSSGAFSSTIAPPNAGPNLVVGDFAWIVGSEGRASLVNIFDACPAPNVQQFTSGPFTPACSNQVPPGGAMMNWAYSFAFAQGFAGHPVPTRLDRTAHRLRQGNNRIGAAPINCTDNGGAPRIQDESAGNNFSVTVNGAAAGGVTDGGVTSNPSLVQGMLPVVPPAISSCASSGARSIAIYDPDHVRNETWDLSWEGVIPGTTRSTLTPGQTLGNGADVFTDPGGSWCSRGVKAGDKLQLNGCSTDADCDYTQTCVRDPGQPPEVPNGLCLDRTAPNNQAPADPTVANDCSILLRAFKRYRILHAYQGKPLPTSNEVSDWLRIGEIYEPEHPDFTHACDPAVQHVCDDVLLVGPKDPNGIPLVLPTSCLQDSDGQHRCLRGCDPNAADLLGRSCAADYLCVGPGQSMVPSSEAGRCMRAPVNGALFAECLKELQPYELHAGEAFLVSGSASGYLNDFEPDPTTRECVVPPVSSPFVRLHQGRIPLGGAAGLTWCPPPSDPRHLVDPLAPLDPSLPNVCLDLGDVAPASCTPGVTPTAMCPICLPRSDVPAPGGFCVDPTQPRRIHFENIYYAIELSVPTHPTTGIIPADTTDVKFIVVGGGFPLTAALGVDAQAQQPRAIVTAPDRQTVFVVDEGKASAATGLRGQLLRVSTAVQATDRSFQVR